MLTLRWNSYKIIVHEKVKAVLENGVYRMPVCWCWVMWWTLWRESSVHSRPAAPPCPPGCPLLLGWGAQDNPMTACPGCLASLCPLCSGHHGLSFSQMSLCSDLSRIVSTFLLSQPLPIFGQCLQSLEVAFKRLTETVKHPPSAWGSS